MNSLCLKVLILDDDEDDTFLICDTINEIVGTTYRTEVAHTPDDAMALIREHQFQLILCDYRLGATSGIDFIRDIRASGIDMPVILLTGMEDRSTDDEALAAGAADFLNKSNISAPVIDRAIRYAVANAERQRLLSTVLTSVNAAVCVLNERKRPALWNPSFQRLAQLHKPGGEDAAVISFCNRLLTAETVHTVGERILDKKMSNLPDNRSVITLHDVTEHIEALRERERAENKAAHLAKHCSLTGLPNRVAFAERIGEEITKAKETGREFYLLNLDLNKFKEVNDVFGHHVGDQLLIEVAQRLRACCSENDYLARLGGDEFVAIQLKKKGSSGTPDLAEKFAQAVCGSFKLSNRVVRTGVSVGFASYPAHGTSAQELLSNADIAMYRAKADPNSRVHAYDSQLDQVIREQRIITNDLREAIENETLDVHFQPQADAQTGKITGFEALARWNHPRHGPVSPSTFIPIAEENGLIDNIGRNILRRSCEHAMAWPEPVNVAVNISGVQIRYTDLVSTVRTILFETGLPSNRLELEVTESVLIDDFDYAMHVLRGIKNLGVSLAMDDFGTGYSSLSSLIAFPFDKLKIDRSFVMELGNRARMATVTKAIIGLGKNLDLKILAEGVEHPEHIDFLRSEGCDEMQGFLIGRPMPQSQVTQYLEDGNDGQRDEAMALSNFVTGA